MSDKNKTYTITFKDGRTVHTPPLSDDGVKLLTDLIRLNHQKRTDMNISISQDLGSSDPDTLVPMVFINTAEVLSIREYVPENYSIFYERSY